MAQIHHRRVATNGIELHIAEAGSGPLVVMCHGFPESWYSWRHQLHALADAGYHAVAPDMRGYGRSDAPDEIERYSMFHLVGDLVGLVTALGETQAVVAGHDWGAPVAWHAALLRPEVFRAVAALSVPHRPRGQGLPTPAMPQSERSQFYQLYFQEPGVAEAELQRNVRHTMRVFLYSISGNAPEGLKTGMVRRGGGFLDGMVDPDPLPPWLSERDIDFYTAEFARTGFRGALNWYRNIDRNWSLLAPWAGAKVTVPALYVTGTRDPVIRFPGADQHIARLAETVPRLARSVMLEGCGHWTQQERPQEVNQALIEFLRGLG